MDCMRKSDSYYRRKELMQKSEVPMMSEIREVLGDPLADVFFKQCPEPLKPNLGITPKLQGHEGDLWVSPSDLLIGKLVLKPPLTSRHIRALTHEGIIEIGASIEQKFMNEMELQKEDALKAQEEYLNFLADRRLNNAVERVTQDLTKIFEDKIRELMNDFEDRLADELAALESKLRAEFEITLQKRDQESTDYWRKKLVSCIQETVSILTQRYLEQLRAREDQLEEAFNMKISREKKRLQVSLEIEEKHCRSRLNQLKHNLECKSIANMMYILCMERRKYQAEIKALEDTYKKEVKELDKTNALRQAEINELAEQLNNVRAKLSLREEFLLEIIRQFQKFINFALKATPTQAEFLLSVEKMMLFELAATVDRFNRRKSKEFDGHLMPWKSASQIDVSSKESLQAPDYHKCSSQLSEPRSNASEGNLPAFYYNNKLYVREEFRNMISQDIELSKTNLLWNKDVENLMVILKSSVDKLNTEVSYTTYESFVEKEKPLASSSAHYQSRTSHLDKDLRLSSIHGLSTKGNSLLSIAPSLEVLDRSRKEHIMSSSERLGLLATTDSLTKYKSSMDSKKRLACIDDIDETSVSSGRPHERVRKVLSYSQVSEDKMQLPDYDERLDDECYCTDEMDVMPEEMYEENELFSLPQRLSVQSCESKYKRQRTQSENAKKQSKISLHVDSFELFKKQTHSSILRYAQVDTRHEIPLRRQASSVVFMQSKRPDRYSINDSPWKSYCKTSVEPKKSSSKTKKPKVTGVIGDKTAKEHLQQNNEFTVDRMTSIMKILNKQPSLLRLFTGCTMNH